MAQETIEKTNSRIKPTAKWRVSYSPIFLESFERHLTVFRDLEAKIERFLDVKIENPISARCGKHDSAMTGDLVGYWHCHLRDDAVLIYNLANSCINLVYIASHAEIEGKRLKRTAAKLSPFNLYKRG